MRTNQRKAPWLLICMAGCIFLLASCGEKEPAASPNQHTAVSSSAASEEEPSVIFEEAPNNGIPDEMGPNIQTVYLLSKYTEYTSSGTSNGSLNYEYVKLHIPVE